LAHELVVDLVKVLRSEGVNLVRWRILAVLAMADGITISEISEGAMMQQSALSRMLMTMEHEGYIVRALRREDERCVEIFLANKGREAFRALNAVVRRRENRLLQGFSREDTDAAFELVQRLRRNIQG
jgi:DNA-binding MarR family transcriptional regulator